MSDVVTEDVENEGSDTPTNNPDAEGQQAGTSTSDKTFTQDDIDAIVARTIARERSKHEKALEEQKKAKDDESMTELQKLQKELEDLRNENASAKLTALRNKVSADTGVPVKLLTGDDEESLQAQAAAIQDFAKAQAPTSSTTPKENLKSGNTSDSKELSREEILERVKRVR